MSGQGGGGVRGTRKVSVEEQGILKGGRKIQRTQGGMWRWGCGGKVRGEQGIEVEKMRGKWGDM